VTAALNEQAAEQFILREARLLDRHRFSFRFVAPAVAVGPVRARLDGAPSQVLAPVRALGAAAISIGGRLRSFVGGRGYPPFGERAVPRPSVDSGVATPESEGIW
jgi:hypothetical protein